MFLILIAHPLPQPTPVRSSAHHRTEMQLRMTSRRTHSSNSSGVPTSPRRATCIVCTFSASNAACTWHADRAQSIRPTYQRKIRDNRTVSPFKGALMSLLKVFARSTCASMATVLIAGEESVSIMEVREGCLCRARSRF